MNEDAIRIRIDFVNKQEAKSFLDELRKAVSDKTLQKIDIRANIQNRQELLSFLAEMRSEINRLNATKISLQVDYSNAIKNAEEFKQAMAGLDKTSSSYLRFKKEYDNEMAKAKGIKDEIGALDRYTSALKLAKKELQEQSGERQKLLQDIRRNIQAHAEEAKSVAASKDRATQAIEKAKEARAREAEESQRAAREIEEAERRAADSTEDATDRIMASLQDRAGVFMEMAQTLTGFADSFTTSLQGINQIFDFGIVRQGATFLRSAVLNATGGAFQDIVTRYDILTTFKEYMGAIGITADEAQKALDRVDQSIRGIPIGLDESAQRLRRYQMFLDDLDQATNLTIGVQSAIFAGGANDQMRRTALYEIDRLLSAGMLNTARQWNALLQGMGVSTRYIAMELGAGTRELPELLATGQIPAQRFLEALMSLGEGSSDAARQLQELLNIYKGTLESWLSNLEYSIRRGGERITRAFNDSLINSTGIGLTGYMSALRDTIDAAGLSVSAFIRDNSKDLGEFVSSFGELLTAFEKFSAADIAQGGFGYLMEGIRGLKGIIDAMPADEVEQFLSYVMTMSVPMERLMGMASGGTAVQAGMVRRFMDLDQVELMEKLARNMGILEEAVYGLTSAISDDALTEFIADMTVFGKPAIGVIGQLAETLGWLQIITQGKFGVGAIAFFQTLRTHVLLAMAGVKTFIAELAPLVGGALGGAVTAGGGLLISGMGIGYKKLDEYQQQQFESNNRLLASLDSRLGKFEFTNPFGEIIMTQQRAMDFIRAYERELDTLKTKAQGSFGFDEISGSVVGGYSEDEQRLKRALEARLDLLRDYVKDYEAATREYTAVMEGNTTVTNKTLADLAFFKGMEDLEKKTKDLQDSFVNSYTTIKGVISEWNELEEPEPIDFSKILKGEEELGETSKISTQAEIAAEAQKLYENLASLSKGSDKTGAISHISDYISTLIEEDDPQTLYEYIAGLNKSFDDGQGEKLATHFANLATDLEDTSNALALSLAAITNMPDVESARERLEELMGEYRRIRRVLMNGDEPADSEASRVMGGDSFLIDSRVPWNMETRMNNIKSEVEQTISAIGDLATGVKNDYTEVLVGEFDNLAESEEGATEANKAFVDQLNKSNSDISEHQSAVQGLMDDFSSLDANIRNVISTLQELGSMEISPTIHMPETIPKAPVRPNAQRLTHRRGLFSEGGVVPNYVDRLLATGTDTVPAMLTPGEFVIKRDAVKKYGVSLFNKLNSMDMGGLFTSAMPQLPSLSRVSYTYNTTRNDNRSTSVNQYITTNNPDYTYRVASRFAYGLQ